MVMIDNEFMYMFAKRLALFAGGLGGRLYVRMVLDAVYLQMHPIGWVMW
jgi:hypothetical protein